MVIVVSSQGGCEDCIWEWMWKAGSKQQKMSLFTQQA